MAQISVLISGEQIFCFLFFVFVFGQVLIGRYGGAIGKHMASAQLHIPSPPLPDPPLCREAGHCRIKTGHMLIRVDLALRGRWNGGDRDLCRVWPSLHCSIGGCVFGVCVYKEISIAWFHKKYVCSSSNDVRIFFRQHGPRVKSGQRKEKERKRGE